MHNTKLSMSSKWIFPMAALAVLASGCESTGSSVQLLDSGLGKVRVHGRVENADGSIQHASVEVRQIRIRNVDGSFISFQVVPFELDLAQLGQSLAPILGTAQVPDGLYDQVRLITADRGVIAFSDGSQSSLDFPSGPESGIKVMLDTPIAVRNGRIAKITLVIDLSRSFVGRGDGTWNFKPVVRPVVAEYVDPTPGDSTSPAGDDPDLSGGTGSNPSTDPTTGPGTVTDPGTVIDYPIGIA
jgi:hypothetical protein